MKEIVKIKAVAEAAYDRSIGVGLVIDNCDVCKVNQIPCLFIDTSDGEYGGGCICKRCVINLFAQGEDKHEGSRILSGDL